MELGIAATSLIGGFFGGIVIGYALKKVAKLITIVLDISMIHMTVYKNCGKTIKWFKDPVTDK